MMAGPDDPFRAEVTHGADYLHLCDEEVRRFYEESGAVHLTCEPLMFQLVLELRRLRGVLEAKQ